MLPQTNLQLYRLMIQGGIDVESLARVRAAYDVSRQLFAGAFRPSHKPFLCHLVGVGGALADWGESVDVTIAGLLHSAYLYGRFDDGAKGSSPRRRDWLRRIVGAEVEALVFAYTHSRWNQWTAGGLREAIASDRPSRQVTTIKLADLLDEFSDNGPQYSPAKPLEFRLHEGSAAQNEFLSLVDDCVGPRATARFREAFATLDSMHVPQSLRSGDRSFHVQTTGVPELKRSPLGRTLARLQRNLFPSRAA